MKRIKFLVASLTSLFMLASCGTSGGGAEPKHEHTYQTTVIQATCSEQGYIIHKCSGCGDNYKNNYTSPLGHNFINNGEWVCSRCGRNENQGFTFKEATMDGESCYAITNADSSTVVNGVLNIPRKYNSLPVRGIVTYSFSGIAKNVKKMLVHDNIKNIYSYLWNGTSIWTPDLEFECPIEEVVFDNTCKNMRVESLAFYNCTKLSRANVAKGMIKYIPCDAVTTSSGGNAEYLFCKTPYFNSNAAKKNGLCYIADLLLHAEMNSVTQNVSIDEGTVAVNASILYKSTVVKTLYIPKSVLSIGIKAFGNCSNLETINYGGTKAEFGSISIAEGAFSSLKAKSVI